MSDLDSLFAGLIAEAEEFKRKGGRIAKTTGKPTFAPPTSGPKAKSPSVTAIEAIDAAIAKRKKDLEELRKGQTPAGWKKVCLTATVARQTCEGCGSVHEALSPATIFLVHSAIRNPSTRHLIPLSRLEMEMHLASGLELHIERCDATVPACLDCLIVNEKRPSFSLSSSPQNPPESPNLPEFLKAPVYPIGLREEISAMDWWAQLMIQGGQAHA